MIYIFDTSSFVVLKNFYPSTFATLWSNLDSLITQGTISSVSEAYNELLNYNDVDYIQDWAKKNKSIFLKPTNAELEFVSQIFKVTHFQYLIGNQAMLKGTPVADPFVIASAKVKNGIVVTEEKYKSNAAKIPNVCQHFKIDCINLETFMSNQGWKF
jgi:hypothetical protein